MSDHINFQLAVYPYLVNMESYEVFYVSTQYDKLYLLRICSLSVLTSSILLRETIYHPSMVSSKHVEKLCSFIHSPTKTNLKDGLLSYKVPFYKWHSLPKDHHVLRNFWHILPSICSLSILQMFQMSWIGLCVWTLRCHVCPCCCLSSSHIYWDMRYGVGIAFLSTNDTALSLTVIWRIWWHLFIVQTSNPSTKQIVT